MARVLVTCVGSGVGQSVLDSLNQLREDYIIGCDMNRNVYATHYCDEFHFVPGLYTEGYLDVILRIAIESRADIIIPGHDHELLLMSKNIEKFHSHGIEVIVSEPTIIEVSRDKYLWYEYFDSRGCSIVPTFKVGDFKKNPDLSIFPAIIKPSGGSASQGISIVHEISELEEMENNDIIQPYLFPTEDDENYETIVRAVRKRNFVQMSEISIQLIFGKDAKFKAIFISKNVLKNGVPVHVDPIQPEDFEYLDEIMKFVPLCEEKGVMGPVNVQGRITEKGILFFEMNMRFTGITGNRAQLGFNEVKYLVNDFLGVKSAFLGYSENKVGVRQVACTTINRLKQEVKSKNLTILGGGGSLGSEFIRSVLSDNQFKRIILICRDSSYERYVSSFSNPNFLIFKGSDPLIQTVYNQTDVLVNFVGALANQPEENKFSATLFLLEQIKKISIAGIPLVINASSQSVYDQKKNERKVEDDDVVINNSYAFQKYITEEMFKVVRYNYPLGRTISLRFPRLLGVSDGGNNGFFQAMIFLMKNSNEVVISNPANNTTLLHISDAVAAINFIINNDLEYPEVLNVGGVDITMKEYAESVADYLQADKELIKYGELSTAEVSSQIDGTVLRQLGWKCEKNLVDIIADLSSI